MRSAMCQLRQTPTCDVQVTRGQSLLLNVLVRDNGGDRQVRGPALQSIALTRFATAS